LVKRTSEALNLSTKLVGITGIFSLIKALEFKRKFTRRAAEYYFYIEKVWG
jgi:hypothetical protein